MKARTRATVAISIADLKRNLLYSISGGLRAETHAEDVRSTLAAAICLSLAGKVVNCRGIYKHPMTASGRLLPVAMGSNRPIVALREWLLMADFLLVAKS